jgi:hypothetical protein
MADDAVRAALLLIFVPISAKMNIDENKSII